MAAYDKVLVEIADGIATLTLHRPEKLNALDLELCEDLIAALETVSGSQHVRVIVLTGAGRGFCAGADLKVLGPQGEQLVASGVRIAQLIRNAPQPVIGAINGAAAGGGANLALACDYRIASDQAKIGQVFHKLGLGVDWGGSFFSPAPSAPPERWSWCGAPGWSGHRRRWPSGSFRRWSRRRGSCLGLASSRRYGPVSRWRRSGAPKSDCTRARGAP